VYKYAFYNHSIDYFCVITYSDADWVYIFEVNTSRYNMELLVSATGKRIKVDRYSVAQGGKTPCPSLGGPRR
jgi:hypothetical protein